MDKKKLVITVATPLIIGLILGYILGIVQIRPIIQTPGEKITLPESKVILNWTATASGEITKISNRTLTLNNEGDELAILIIEEAPIISLILPEEPAEPGEEVGEMVPEQKEIKFEELKVGDRVDVFTELTPEREWRGINVVVVPW